MEAIKGRNSAIMPKDLLEKDLSPIDEAATRVYERSPNFFRAIMLAPLKDRAKLFTLIAFDMELFAIESASKEPMVNAIKRAWWLDAIARLPKGKEDHYLLTLIDEYAFQSIALAMCEARQEDKESLPIIVREMAHILGVDAVQMEEAISHFANAERIKKNWPKASYPIIAMLGAKTRMEAFKLSLFGRL